MLQAITVFSLLVSQALASPPLIGYGSSDAVLPAKDQELFYTGFELGFQFAAPGKKTAESVISDQISDGSKLAAIGSAERLVSKGIVALVGFPTSHEALLAAKVAVDKKMIGIFIGASHSKLAELGPYIFTTGQSTHMIADSLLKLMVNRFAGKQGLLITNPDATFSVNLEDAFKAIHHDTGSPNLETVHLDGQLKLPSNYIQRLKNNEFGFIAITSFASEAKALMEQLGGAGIDLPTIVNSTWVTGDIEFVQRLLSTKSAPVYGQTDWLAGSPDSLTFERELKRKFGKRPSLEIAYGFDLGVVVGVTLRRVKGIVTRDSFARTLWANLCFDQTASGRICFSPSGGHANRPLRTVQILKSGMKLVRGK